MGNCITAPFRRNYQNRSGTRAAGRGAAGGGARVGADGSTGGPGLGWRGAGVRLARGWGSVGAGRGPGGAGERASMGTMRRRGQHEGGRKSPIDSSSRPQWAARRMAACVGAMRAAKRDACKTAAMNAGEMAGGRRPRRTQARWQGGRMRQAGQARAAGRKARSAMLRVACRCRMAQSPFGRTAGRCRRKAGRRWQHLRAMRDFGLLDAKKGPWRQDSRAMYPESPDCARKRMHGARMLPS